MKKRQMLISGPILIASTGYFATSYYRSANFYDQRFVISVVGMAGAIASICFFASLMPSKK